MKFYNCPRINSDLTLSLVISDLTLSYDKLWSDFVLGQSEYSSWINFHWLCLWTIKESIDVSLRTKKLLHVIINLSLMKQSISSCNTFSTTFFLSKHKALARLTLLDIMLFSLLIFFLSPDFHELLSKRDEYLCVHWS